MKKLLIRTITGIFFVSLIIVSLFFSVYLFYFLFLFFTIIGNLELKKMGYHLSNAPQFIAPLLLSVLLFSLFSLIDTPYILYCMLLITLLICTIPIVELYKKDTVFINNLGLALLTSLWLAIPFGILGYWSYGAFRAPNIVLALFIIIWLYDSLAYCAGSLAGKHQLFGRISPKKSWEGFIIAFVLTAGASISFFYIPFFYCDGLNSVWKWVTFAIIIMITATYGDLTESMLKRACNVKDSGRLLPGHGGVLDRFDSLFFAVPVAFIYWLILHTNF